MNGKRKTILGIFTLATVVAMAQGPRDFGDVAEKIEEEKVAFISTRLNLSVEEGQIFWPVYNERNDAMKALRDEYMQKEKDIIGDNELSELEDSEIEELMSMHFEKAQAELDLRIDYHDMLLEVLSVEQVAKFYKAEEDFKRKLMELLKEKGIDPPKEHLSHPDGPHGK